MKSSFAFEPEKYFSSCHASCLYVKDRGTRFLVYFAGSNEGHPDVSIRLSRMRGGQWEPPIVLAKASPEAHWNPVIFPAPHGIRVYFKVGAKIPEWLSWTMFSADDGDHWSEPVPCGSAAGPLRSHPLLLSDGSLLAPTSVETPETWCPRIDISRDGGETFDKLAEIPLNTQRKNESNYLEGLGAIQPALWEDTAGIHAFLRTTAGRIFRSDSSDGGKNWCEAYPTALPNNNSGIDVLYTNGSLYLACNPVGKNWGARNPLSLLRSDDGGEHFETVCDLAHAEEPGEYSYPSLYECSGVLYCSFTYRRRTICVSEISL